MGKRNRLNWIAGVSAQENSRQLLPSLIRKFLDTGDGAVAQNPADTNDLHQFRLAAKRLRYTLELFRPCYGKAMESRIESLKKVQDALGEMQDSAVARRLIEKKMPKSALRREWLAKLEARAQEKVREFQQIWQERFAGEVNRRKWLDYFGREGSVRKPPAEDSSANRTPASAAG